MSFQDPISDMITCIRNGQKASKILVYIPFSKLKENITKVLEQEGYILNYEIVFKKHKILKIILKYFQGKPVIENIVRVSKPSLRKYNKKNKLFKIMNGLGISIISTSKGIITDHSARKLGIGGEVLCYVE